MTFGRYRFERRNRWHKEGACQSGLAWADYNDSPRVRGHIPTKTRSKYMPHESVKQGGVGPVFA